MNFVGIDPSDKMLNEARVGNKEVNWLTEDKIFDGAIATLTIHHWKDLEKAFMEIDRVLSGNARIVNSLLHLSK